MYRLLNWNYWRQRIEDCTNSCQDTTMRSILKLAILFTFKKRPTTYGVKVRTLFIKVFETFSKKYATHNLSFFLLRTYRIEGVNLRTGRQGIFPSAYAVDMDYSDFDPSAPKVKRERYLLGYLGSVETLAHKGTGVVCQAVRRIVGNSQESPVSQSCILEVSDQGLRMVDRSKPRVIEYNRFELN